MVLSELEREAAAKAELKTELEILKALDSKSAGKIKYYMRVGPSSGQRQSRHPCDSHHPQFGGRRVALSRNQHANKQPQTPPHPAAL